MFNNEQVLLKYSNQFENLILLQEKIKHINGLLENYYPIAIVEDGFINIFDYDPDHRGFTLKLSTPDTFGIIAGVRAAFPLKCYNNKACVVVSGDIFDSVEEQVIIFHEYVHCYQFDTCEIDLRRELDIAQKFVNTKDYYWELQYPFPYDDPQIVSFINKLFSCINGNSLDEVFKIRKEIMDYLNKEQYEYMFWQEWKEGFARYIENKIKVYLELQPNHGGATIPFSRTTFYETGSRLIEKIINDSPNIALDIKKLFKILRDNSMKV